LKCRVKATCWHLISCPIPHCIYSNSDFSIDWITWPHRWTISNNFYCYLSIISHIWEISPLLFHYCHLLTLNFIYFLWFSSSLLKFCPSLWFMEYYDSTPGFISIPPILLRFIPWKNHYYQLKSDLVNHHWFTIRIIPSIRNHCYLTNLDISETKIWE